MDENLKKKLMMEEMFEVDKEDLNRAFKQLYDMFKACIDAGFNEGQAMAIVLHLLSGIGRGGGIKE